MGESTAGIPRVALRELPSQETFEVDSGSRDQDVWQ